MTHINVLQAAVETLLTGPLSVAVSILTLGVIGLFCWKGIGRQVIVVLTVLLYARYIVWRGAYTINTEDLSSLLLGWSVYLAELYAFVQILLLAYHTWNPLERTPVALTQYPTVDIFVTVVNEPLHILRRTLIGCLHQDYPKDRYRVYVLDDGQREDIRTLAKHLECGYLRRADRAHAKAGNLNHALQQTAGDLLAIFDVDHVPTSSFLRKTVGFFNDPKVAFVQTPHHFYNPDIFQKNLRLEGVLKNEQSLFYRVLQAGRDRHNSAFFAGSCGLFRRGPLQEIGGFRTETVTEDIHTSMALHAQGYRSCYLNEVLAVGLAPETFESFIKQRVRWAMGHVQILVQSNPLLMRGLTVHQRLGYFTSILYFLHGLPRLIAVGAPLGALLFGIIPVVADLPSLVHFFGAYYVSTLLMLRTVSRGTRNAFWSDVYETAGCMALGWAAIKTLMQPWKKRPFVITPKGQQQEQRGFSKFSYVVPHLVLFGLLVAGLSNGVYHWLNGGDMPGLAVSLFWGSINLVLLAVAMLSAVELPEWRKAMRVRCQIPCVVISPEGQVTGTVEDLSEHGGLVVVPHPLRTEAPEILLSLATPHGDRVTVTARVRRQVRRSPESVGIGLEFLHLEAKTVYALLALMSADAQICNQPEVEPGIGRSLWSLLSVLRMLYPLSRSSQRRHRRVRFHQTCRLEFRGRALAGTVHDVTLGGLSVKTAASLDLLGEDGILYLEHFVVKVRRMWAMECEGEMMVGFRIERIDRGADQWRELHSLAA
jgi:cellulose synthase (UDP-forming)